MKITMRIALMMFLVAGCAFAQGAPKADVSASYSYLRLGGTGGVNQQGGTVAFTGYLSNWLGIVGDLGVYHSSLTGGSLNTFTFLAGPRVSANRQGTVSPFVQVLLGGAHLTASADGFSAGATPFAFSAGGGVDFRLSKHVALRPEIDYLTLRASGQNLSALRGSVGIVFRFGERK